MWRPWLGCKQQVHCRCHPLLPIVYQLCECCQETTFGGHQCPQVNVTPPLSTVVQKKASISPALLSPCYCSLGQSCKDFKTEKIEALGIRTRRKCHAVAEQQGGGTGGPKHVKCYAPRPNPKAAHFLIP